jgi:hypothetical protein
LYGAIVYLGCDPASFEITRGDDSLEEVFALGLQLLEAMKQCAGKRDLGDRQECKTGEQQR